MRTGCHHGCLACSDHSATKQPSGLHDTLSEGRWTGIELDFVRIKYSEIRMNQELIVNYPIYYAKIKLQITDNKELLLNKIDDLLR